VDAELDPIPSSEVSMNAAIWACAAGCIALVATAVSAFGQPVVSGLTATDLRLRPARGAAPNALIC